MKQLNFIDKKTKADYRNWVPKRLLEAKIIESLVCLILFILFGASDLILQGRQRIIWGIILGIGCLILLLITVWVSFLYRAFDYKGKRKLAKVIIEGTADYVKIPDGGVGLDVGCGSGALTIACAKKIQRRPWWVVTYGVGDTRVNFQRSSAGTMLRLRE